MALNFPASPTNGQIFKPGKTQWIYSGGRWTAQDRRARNFNYLVNPGASVSLQNVDNAGTSNNYFVADQWQTAMGTAGILVNSARTATTDPNYAPYYIGSYNSAANAAPAAGDFWSIRQNVENTRARPLQGGVAAAQPLVVRFTVQATVAGTYCLTIRAAVSGGFRSYCTPIAVTTAAKAFEIAIPADTGGAWDDGNNAFSIFFVFACGSTYIAPSANAWNAGNYLGVSGMNNLAATINQQFVIGRFGVYADPNGTGRAPPWELPIHRQIVQDSQRYWHAQAIGFGVAANNAAATPQRSGGINPVPMRTTPAVTFVGSVTASDTTVVTTFSSIPNNFYNPYYDEANFGGSAAQTLGRPAITQPAVGNYIAVNARN